MLDEKYAVTSVGGSTASASNAVSTPTHVVLPNAPAVPAPASTNPPSKFADRYAERLAELRQQAPQWFQDIVQDTEAIAQDGPRTGPRTGPSAGPSAGRSQDNPDPGHEDEEEEDDDGAAAGSSFAEYWPAKWRYGVPHPHRVVESASLAAVQPPDITYELSNALLKRIRDGKLSVVQAEAIVYACQRFENHLEDPGQPIGPRAGFFLGDGAGVGKGRTIAGLLLEQWQRGRTKAVWVSTSGDLVNDARRDIFDLDVDYIPVHAFNKQSYKRLPFENGVLFVTYSMLTSQSDSRSTRLKQIIEWLGPDFDGVVAFDESHKAKNLLPTAKSMATKVGKAVEELQKRLPEGRFLYCSATGVSELRNIAYMARLGLWGPSTGFPSFNDFSIAIGRRGVVAMELVAMDMKARGMYIGRSLSFDGVEFQTIECPMPDDVAEQYAQATVVWWRIFSAFKLAISKGGEGHARSYKTWMRFWGCHQRFFNQLCIAAKVPEVVRQAKAALEQGECVVIGLQTTGEAATEAARGRLGEVHSDFVSGPRELLHRLINEGFPASVGDREVMDLGPPQELVPRVKRRAAANHKYIDRHAEDEDDADAGKWESDGDEYRGTSDDDSDVMDSQSMQQPTTSHATKLRTLKRMLLEQVDAMQLPKNPLDELIDKLGGPDGVAEMTGRVGRVVRNPDGINFSYRRRNEGLHSNLDSDMDIALEQVNLKEKELFLKGEKLVAIISEAASAGISLHADRRFANQRRRVHITLELPWAADRAIQQLGRSHRSGQTTQPLYKLVFTPLGGERRFACAVARRLASMGALTQGDRRAAHVIRFDDYNFDNQWGRQALKLLFDIIRGKQTPMVDPTDPSKSFESAQNLMTPETHAVLAGFRADLLNVGIFQRSHLDVSVVNEHGVDVKVPVSPEQMQAHEVPMADPPTEAPAACIKPTDDHGMARFLNRLLGLPPTKQQPIFAYYLGVLKHVEDEAKRKGTYDRGIKDVPGLATLQNEPQLIYTTFLYDIVTDRGVSWAMACKLREGASLEEARTADVVCTANAPAEAPPTATAEAPPAAAPAHAAASRPSKKRSTQRASEQRPLVDVVNRTTGPGPAQPVGVKREGRPLLGPQPAMQQPHREIIQIDGQDSDDEDWHPHDDECKPLRQPKRARVGRPAVREAASVDAGMREVVVVDSDSDCPDAGTPPRAPVQGSGYRVDSPVPLDSLPKIYRETTLGAAAAVPAPWGPGDFFLEKPKGLGFSTNMLLALPMKNTESPVYRIVRPNTGFNKSNNLWSHAELLEKYKRLPPERVRAKWERMWTKYDQLKRPGDSREIRQGARKDTKMMLVGPVLPVLGTLDKAGMGGECSMEILRLPIHGPTGASQRIVGLEVPGRAVTAILNKLEALQRGEVEPLVYKPQRGRPRMVRSP